MNKSALYQLSYGVYIITTMNQGKPTGCTANSAMQITSDPAGIAVSINHDNFTNSCIRETNKFAINILSEQSDPFLIGAFGFQSGKTVNKFDNVAYEMKEGVPIIKGACAYMICEVVSDMETSSHTVFLGNVLDADVLTSDTPMTYAYYHKVIKGKSPKNAPTYIAEEPAKAPAEKYVCSICGYVYDGETPFESLPEDFRCPVCKQPKSVFVKK
jgi:flavin reductase (DIM6/NTAB) family NADH-FMN oxidoreductase RutF/rubredoxin